MLREFVILSIEESIQLKMNLKVEHGAALYEEMLG
jgi:hypothetical protein